MKGWVGKLSEFYRKHRVAETSTALIAVWWGLALLHPDKTFTLPSYQPMLDMAPELSWAFLALFIGVFQYIGMIKGNFLLRTISSLLATGFWICVGVVFLMIPVINTAGGTYIILGLMTGWVYVMVGAQR